MTSFVTSFFQWVLIWQVFYKFFWQDHSIWVFSDKFFSTSSVYGVFLIFKWLFGWSILKLFECFFDSVGFVDWNSIIHFFIWKSLHVRQNLQGLIILAPLWKTYKALALIRIAVIMALNILNRTPSFIVPIVPIFVEWRGFNWSQ